MEYCSLAITWGSNMLKASLALGAMLALSTGAVAQTPPANLPMGIMCFAEADQSWRVGHLHKVDKNGDAIYLSADGRLSATVNAKGVVLKPKDRPAGLDCYGKTLDELRSNGRVR